MTKLYVDGGCSGNGQFDLSKRKMVSVVTDESGAVISEQSAAGGSNNIAELLAVELALAYCESRNISAVKILTDSRNNLAWTFGKKVGKKLNDRALVIETKRRIDSLMLGRNVQMAWIPREQNRAGHYIERTHGL